MKNLFYQPVKVDAKDPDVLFWGCLHYGHDPKWDVPLWARRGYKSSADHDQGIIDAWRSKATDRTIAFLLGDNVFGYGGEQKLRYLFDTLPFKTAYVLSGNHHAGWKQVFESCEGNTLQLGDDKSVVFVPNYLETYVNGQPIVLSHYPIASWNGQGHGSWHLHSHCHGSLYDSELGKLLYRAKIKDVGVDCCPAPLSFGDLRHEFREESVSFDHHLPDTRTPFTPLASVTR